MQTRAHASFVRNRHTLGAFSPGATSDFFVLEIENASIAMKSDVLAAETFYLGIFDGDRANASSCTRSGQSLDARARSSGASVDRARRSMRVWIHVLCPQRVQHAIDQRTPRVRSRVQHFFCTSLLRVCCVDLMKMIFAIAIARIA